MLKWSSNLLMGSLQPIRRQKHSPMHRHRTSVSTEICVMLQSKWGKKLTMCILIIIYALCWWFVFNYRLPLRCTCFSWLFFLSVSFLLRRPLICFEVCTRWYFLKVINSYSFTWRNRLFINVFRGQGIWRYVETWRTAPSNIPVYFAKMAMKHSLKKCSAPGSAASRLL